MIYRILNIERLEYKSNLTAPVFKNKLDKIFNQGTLKFKYNLSGKFINDFEFKATDKWTIGIYIRGFENDPAYLKGKITETSNGIIINITVRPNSIFLIFGFLFPIVGFFALFAPIFGNTTEDELMGSLAFIFIGLIFYSLGIF